MLVDEFTSSLWSRAVSHCGCAQELAELARLEAVQNGANDVGKAVFNGRHSVSIHLLSGFSLELYLKVAYLAFGGEKGQLTEIGHDLREALMAAKAQGFEPNPPKTDFVVKNMRSTHLKNHFRYGTAQVVNMPSLEDTFEVLNGLYDQVGELVYG